MPQHCLEHGPLTSHMRRIRVSQNVVDDFHAFHAQLLTECPDIIRGVPLKTVLSDGAYWFRTGNVCNNETISAETASIMYEKSEPAESFKDFMSHSWHAPAWMKCIGVLCMHNGPAAALGGLACSVCVAGLRACRLLPAWNLEAMSTIQSVLIGSPQPSLGISSWCMVGFLVGYVTCFLFWQEIRDTGVRMVGRRSGTIFFDKLSIHQHDKDLQKKGILAISYYLFHSEQLTIAWDRTYFSRMWCVFEMAVYLKVQGIEKVKFEQVFFCVVEFVFIFAVSLSLVVLLGFASFNVPQLFLTWAALESPLGFVIMIFCVSVLVVPLLSFAIRQHVTALADRAAQLKEFSIENGRCFDEADRKYVTDIVVRLYGSAEAFNDYIRNEVAETIAQRYPQDISSLISYCMLARMGAPFFVAWGLDFFLVAEGIDVHTACHGLFGAVVLWLGLVPILVQSVVAIHRFRLRPASKSEKFVVQILLICAFLSIIAAGAYAMPLLFAESMEVCMPANLAILGMNLALLARRKMLMTKKTGPPASKDLPSRKTISL